MFGWMVAGALRIALALVLMAPAGSMAAPCRRYCRPPVRTVETDLFVGDHAVIHVGTTSVSVALYPAAGDESVLFIGDKSYPSQDNPRTFSPPSGVVGVAIVANLNERVVTITAPPGVVEKDLPTYR